MTHIAHGPKIRLVEIIRRTHFHDKCNYCIKIKHQGTDQMYSKHPKKQKKTHKLRELLKVFSKFHLSSNIS